MAAEYEVNIKINTQKVVTDLGKVDRTIKNLGKSANSQEKSLERIVDKRARLMNRINEMEARGLKVSKLRKQMGKATTEQGRKDLANAQKEYRILERSIRLEQSKLRILRAQKQGFPASPIRGIRSMMGSPAQIAASGRQAADPIRGRADLVGSPAYYEAQQKAIDRLARQGGPSDPIKGHPNLIGSPAYFDAQQKEIDKAARQGGARSPLRGSKNLPGSPAYFDAQQKEIEKLARQGGARSPIRGNKDLIGSPAYYEHQRKELERLARKGGPSSPIRGGANMPGSPLALQRGMNRLGQVGLGAGFPLLFGGGPGSVLGGAAGGLTGSFGAQIALSAAGQQIDQLIGRTVASAESLGSVGTALDFLRERSLFSSKESEQLARKLENQGDLTGIAALVTEELNEALGPGGIQKMQDLAEQTRLAKEQWGQLTTNLELLIAGPLAEFLKIVNATLGIKVAQSQFARALTTLQEKDPQRLREMLPSFEGAKGSNRVAEIASNLAFGPNMAGGIFNMQGLSEGALISFTEQMNSIIRGMGTPDGVIPITEEDRKRFKPRKDRAGRDAERLAKRLAGLDAERAKLEQLLQLDQQINTAKLEGDNRQIIALENEARLLQFAEKEAVIRASKVPQEQKIAELRNLSLERDRALLENAFRLDSFDKQKADDLTLQLEQLDLQLEAATAITREAENQAKLELLLLNLREANKDLTEDQLQELMNKTKQLFEAQNQGPLQSFITQSVKSLNDLETQAVQVSQNIGNALGNSIVSGLRNLVTGAESAKKVFADMLMSFADVLAKQAAQMIATYIAIGIARAFAGFGGGGGGKELNLAGVEQYSGIGANTPVTPFAEGGYVSGPTNALVGEAGEPEYVIPESKMRESMARYSRGARGASVIPDSGVSGTSSEGGGTAVAAPIDVRYTVERINSVDYVTADQFQRGLQQAAAQGATQGEQRALTTLRQNTSQRKRIGL